MRTIRLLRVQISLLILLTSISVLSKLGIVPTTQELIDNLHDLFESYGLLAVVVISFVENIVGLNAYFPGSVVILLAMASTAGNPKLAILTFLCIYVPSVLAHNINFWIGRTSKGNTFKSKTKSANKSDPNLNGNAIFLYITTFWHPHFTALTCLAIGAEGVRYGRFIVPFFAISFFWNSIWGILMYNLGDLLNTSGNLLPISISYIIIWALYDYWRNQKQMGNNKSRV